MQFAAREPAGGRADGDGAAGFLLPPETPLTRDDPGPAAAVRDGSLVRGLPRRHAPEGNSTFLFRQCDR